MTEKDKEIQELRRKVDFLQAELLKARLMQRELFRLVPADRIIELLRETPEERP